MTAGKDFEDRIAKRLKKAGCHVQKLYDAPAAFGADRQALPGVQTAFTPKNPYDFLVMLRAGDGYYFDADLPTFYLYALELKTTKGARFDLATVKPHQLKGLRAFPGVSGIVVELRKVQRCFFVDPETIGSWEATHGKKSMNTSDLEGHAVELCKSVTTRETRVYYDVAPILRGGQ